MQTLLSSQKKNTLFKAPKKHEQIQVIQNPAELLLPVFKEPELETDPSKILTTIKKPLYVSQSPEYLDARNMLSEFDTPKEKEAVRKQLGLNTAEWGKISGEIERQTDLVNYLSQLITEVNPDILNNKVNVEIIGEKQASKQIKYLLQNEDIFLNTTFNNAVKQVLKGEQVRSIDDVLAVLLHAVFPITYKDWTIEIENTANPIYTIEYGTQKKLELDTIIGQLTIKLNPGNKNDNVTNLKIGQKDIYIPQQLEYNFDIKIGDIVNSNFIDSTVVKNFNIKLTTDYPATIQANSQSAITIINKQYYFQETYDVSYYPELTEYRTTSSTIYSESNIREFQLKNQEKWITVYSPKKPSNVETSASVDGINWTPFYTTTGYKPITTVTYTPKGYNAKPQTYYRITLDTPQSAYVKVKIT